MSAFEVTCKVCEDTYTDEGGRRKPKILTGCGHTICEICAIKLMSDSKIVCPFDRTCTEVSDGNIDSLLKNFAVLELIDEEKWKRKVQQLGNEDYKEENSEEYAKELALKIPCDENPDHFAVLFCLKCETHLCKWCSLISHSSATLSNHQQVRLTEKPKPIIYCSSHSRNTAELICKQSDCTSESRLMCYMCHLYGVHKGHSHELVETEVDNVCNNLGECLGALEKKITVFKEEASNIEIDILALEETSELSKRMRERVSKVCSDYRKKIDDHEEQCLESFENFRSRECEQLKKNKKDRENDLKQFIYAHEELLKMSKFDKTDITKNYDILYSLMEQAKVEVAKGTKDVVDETSKYYHPTDHTKFLIRMPTYRAPIFSIISKKLISVDIETEKDKSRSRIIEHLKKKCTMKNFPSYSAFVLGDKMFSLTSGKNIELPNTIHRNNTNINDYPTNIIYIYKKDVIDRKTSDRILKIIRNESYNKIAVGFKSKVKKPVPGAQTVSDYVKTLDDRIQYEGCIDATNILDVIGRLFD